MTKRYNYKVEKDHQYFETYKKDYEVEIYLLAKYTDTSEFLAFLGFRDSCNIIGYAYDLILERKEKTRLRNIEYRKFRDDNKDLIKKLRQRTALGIGECMEALRETDLDFDKAVEYIQIKHYGRDK